MIEVPNIFNVYDRFVDTAYAVDFTNHPIPSHTGFELRNSEPTEVVSVDGEQKPIPYFKLSVVPQRHVTFWGINFERNPAVMGGVKQCESMFTPVTGDRPFVLLLEMKYCLPKNADENSLDAFVQLKRTLTYLEQKEIINRNQHRIYLNISIPWSSAEPFESFRETQSDIIKVLENDKIAILGYNSLLIHTETHIKVPLCDV